MTIVHMKSYTYELSYLELAKLFVTTQNQIATWIKRSKFSLSNPFSIFEFYREEGSKISKRRGEFESLITQYKSRSLKDQEQIDYVERLLKEWKRDKELMDKSTTKPLLLGATSNKTKILPLFKK